MFQLRGQEVDASSFGMLLLHQQKWFNLTRNMKISYIFHKSIKEIEIEI